MADRAGDILGRAAVSADNVVVVVVSLRFVPRGVSGRLDAAHKTSVHQCVQIVVDRLDGEVSAMAPGHLGDRQGVRVVPFPLEHRKHRHPWRGNPQAVGAETVDKNGIEAHGVGIVASAREIGDQRL